MISEWNKILFFEIQDFFNLAHAWCPVSFYHDDLASWLYSQVVYEGYRGLRPFTGWF
jgi:hypothetical protein